MFSSRLPAPPLMCLDPALCVCFVTYKARLSFLSRSPRVVTCFVAVRSLNWSFCHSADGKLDSSSAFLVSPQSILSLTTVSGALLSSVTPGEGAIALRDARNGEVLFPGERREPFLGTCFVSFKVHLQSLFILTEPRCVHHIWPQFVELTSNEQRA